MSRDLYAGFKGITGPAKAAKGDQASKTKLGSNWNLSAPSGDFKVPPPVKDYTAGKTASRGHRPYFA